MSSKDGAKAREEIVRDDINRTLRRAGKPMTATDLEHTKSLKDAEDKRADQRRAAGAKGGRSKKS
jgi:hypothetical protein